MNSPNRDIWQELREEQDVAREREQYLASARALRGSWRPVVRRKMSGAWQLSAAAALALTCGVGWKVAVHLRPHEEISFSVGSSGETGQVGAWIAAPSGDVLPLQFSDGSAFLLSAGSRARVSAVDSNGARIVVERGRASASVVHRPSSRWLVDVGPFAVTVVGTRFDVSWDANDEVFKISLREGSVLVEGPCLRVPRPIERGHALRVSCKGAREEIVETRTDAADVDARQADGNVGMTDSNGIPGGSVEPPAFQEAAPRALTSVAEPESNGGGTRRTGALRRPAAREVIRSDVWRTLISAGRFREALDLVEQSGFEQECATASGADLLELGDAARFAGNSPRARQAYLAARRRLPGGGRSTYSLGLTAFDKEKDFESAARWFETYLREQRDGSLRREAEGRLMEAWQRAGNPEKARASAEQYLNDFPDGTQAPLARQLAMH